MREEHAGIFRPRMLNYEDATVAGHGRGVSVLAGWNEPADRETQAREQYFAAKRKSFPPDNEREPGATYVFRV